MATLESVIQKINLLIEDANDTTGSLHNNLRDAVDSLILGYGNIEADSLAEIHVWSKYTIGGSIIEEQVTNVQLFWKLPSSSDIFEIDYADSYEIVDNDISLVNPATITLGSDNESRNAIKGKYVKRGYVYYIPTDAKVSYGNYINSRTIEVDKATKITYTAGDSEFICIVASEDSNAYPQNGTQGGYKYVYNGTLDNAGGCDHVAVTQAVPSITVSESGLITATSKQDGGLVAAGTKTTTQQLSTQGGVAVKPGSTSKTAVAAGKYTTGDVIVMGDSQLVGSNIKSGVSIFGVAGTYEGVELPSLTTPGTADDLAKGKQLIDANGNVVTGTVTTYDAGVTSLLDDKPIYKSGSGSNLKLGFSHEFGYANLFRVGSKFALYTPASNFGDASASDVAKGKTFTSASGVKVTGTHECSGGIELPALTTPGTADDLAKGKQLIDSSGNVVTGTIPVKDIAAQTNVDSIMFDSQGGKISVVAKLGEKTIVSGTASIFTNVPASEFGDATAADVKAGKTFTSAEGLKVVGTMAPSSFTVTDDGAGNVTITSSAITDNDGNVVIA